MQQAKGKRKETNAKDERQRRVIVGSPPPYCFYKERNLRILHRDCWKVGKGRFQEGFRKVHRKDINTWCRIRVQEGSGRFQEGRAGRALAFFFPVRLCVHSFSCLVFLCCVVVCVFFYVVFCVVCCSFLCSSLFAFRFVFRLILFVDSFLSLYVLFSLRYLFYVLVFCFLICVFVCWRLGGLKHTK